MVKSNRFEELKKYKEINHLCTKRDLIKIWQTQKVDFWIEDQNVQYELYHVGKTKIWLFTESEVNRVKKFLDDLASKSNTRQSAYQSYIMLKTTGYSWATKKPSAKEKLRKGKDEMLEKMKKTNLEKYGVKYITQLQEIKDKRNETWKNKYGENYYSLFSQKAMKTILERDGDFSCLRRDEALRIKRYFWNGENFDSKWEIYFWQYLKDNNIEFKFQTEIEPILYFYKNRRCYYNPDFMIGNKIIEIKNDYLLKLMIKDIDKKEHYKYLCMLDNNVEILIQKDIKPYKKYFVEHYDESEIIETNYRRNYKNKNVRYFEFKCLENGKFIIV